MSGRPTLAFWFEFASTYSYPAAMTVEAEATARGVTVLWRPFLLGPIFARLGWRDSPFNLQPAKGAYMWHDLQRTCARLGLPFRRPPGFPQRSVGAARAALVGEDSRWGPAYVRAVFHAQFAEGADIAEEAVLARALVQAGADPADVLARAAQEPPKAALRARVAEAETLGIFGAPSFVAKGDLYWGFDRMVEALDRAAAP